MAYLKYAYDPVGNITSITDRDGTVQKYTYDKLNRRTEKQWLDINGQCHPHDAITYNAAGELTNRLTNITYSKEANIISSYA